MMMLKTQMKKTKKKKSKPNIRGGMMNHFVNQFKGLEIH